MTEQTLEFTVPDDKKKERLDVFLASRLPSVTRAKIKNLIDADEVMVDGKPTKAGHAVKPGEVILVHFPTPPKPDLEPEDIPLDIVYEDDVLLVVNKPPGMVVHPAYGNMSGTLVNALLAHCNRLSDVAGTQRPGLVHRLDKDTSGILVVAKDDVSHVFLARQLQAHKIDREYRAIVWGHFCQKQGRVEAALGRHPKDRTRMMIRNDGKHAITNYNVLEELALTSFMQLKLETGRTHQIRVHMTSLGHPVFSDSTYGGRGKLLSGLNANRVKFVNSLFKSFKRQMLHAHILTFQHPVTLETMRFEAPLPDDMQELLEILRHADV